MLTFTDTYCYTPQHNELQFWEENYLLFDIETTGLSAKYNTIYMIGCAYHHGTQITLLQYFAENSSQEAEILDAFFELAQNFQGLLSFNGIRFDENFIRERCQKLHISSDALPANHFDIYKACRNMKSVLQLPSYRQKAIESFLGIHRMDRYSGGELISVYESYTKEPNEDALSFLKLHNYEDVAGMVEILPILAYTQLKNATFSISDVTVVDYTDYTKKTQEELQFHGTISFTLPAPLRLHNDYYYMVLENNTIRGSIFLLQEKMYHFLSNPKDYYYLPGEDMVVPKALATHIDSSQKQKATAANCYIAKDDRYLFVPEALTCSDDIYFFRRTYKAKENFIPYQASSIDTTFLSQYIKSLLQ